MRYILSLIILCLSLNGFANNQIENYQPVFLPVYQADGTLMVALRVFKMNQIPSFLAVNPNTLDTSIIPIHTLYPRSTQSKHKPKYFTREALFKTRYYQLLNQHTHAPYLLENQGVQHAKQNVQANVLTIDLCPSKKAFEADFFHKLVDLSDKLQKPIPITIALSGLWMIEHDEEFQWLLQKEKEHKFDITWANHSFSHVYYPDTHYSENFLLSPGTNMAVEVLLTEQYLLEAGEMPSVFFRFPGLVSDKTLIHQIKKYGLIPLGADAWLAKDEVITPGGIILIHGNSNEHEGIVRVWPWLTKLTWISLKEAI